MRRLWRLKPIVALSCWGVVAALTLLALPARASSSADPPRIVLWHQVGGIGIGLTRARVEYDYGRPSASSSLGPTYTLHGGHVIVRYDRSGHVNYLMVDTPYYKAANGFGVGYRVPLGPCHRKGNACAYAWNGFSYDGVQTWYRSLVWSGGRMQVIISVDRGVVKWFSISKLGTAGVAVPASAAVRQAIITATLHGICKSTPCKFKVSNVRLAKSDTSYAVGRIWDPAIGGAAVLLHRGGDSVWKVISYGSSDVGCSQAPQNVLNDLGLYCQ